MSVEQMAVSIKKAPKPKAKIHVRKRILGFVGALFCAKNISNPVVANIVKSFVAFIRAVPTIIVVALVILLELLATKIKSKVR